MLSQTLDLLLGTRTKVRLLRAFAQSTAPVTGREAQRLAGVRSMAGAGRAFEELTEAGLLHREEAGGAHLYRMNREHMLADPITALFQAEERQLTMVRDTVIEALQAAGLGAAVFSVSVLGSAARGEVHPGSEHALLVVVNDDDAIEPVRAALLDTGGVLRRHLGVRPSPYVLSRERAVVRWREGDPLLASISVDARTLLGAPLADVIAGW